MINVNFPADTATVRTVGCGASERRVKKWQKFLYFLPDPFSFGGVL